VIPSRWSSCVFFVVIIKHQVSVFMAPPVYTVWRHNVFYFAIRPSIRPSVRLLPILWIQHFENEWNSFAKKIGINWSMLQGNEILTLRVSRSEAKVTGDWNRSNSSTQCLQNGWPDFAATWHKWLGLKWSTSQSECQSSRSHEGIIHDPFT